METVKDLWTQQVVPVCRSMMDITAFIIPGKSKENGGPTKKSSATTSEVCTCTAKSHPSNSARSIQLLTPTGQNIIRIAGISGALAVALGAYGAHVVMINPDVPEEQKNSFRTASFYHFIGTFGLVAASLGRRPLLTGTLMATGTLLFCGTCYIHGLTGEKKIKMVAPVGGTTLILAWLSLIL